MRRREGNIMAVGNNITWKKGKWEAILLSYNIAAVGRNIKCGRGEEDGNFGERISSCREVYYILYIYP